MSDVAAPKPHPLTPDRTIAARLREWIEPAGTWLYGFLVVALVAGNTGGYLPTTHGWIALVTLWLAAMGLILKDRIVFGMLDTLFLGGLVAFTAWVALSNLWTPSMTSTMHEVQRNLAYVGIVAAGLVLTSKRTVPHLLGGVLAAITLLSTYALGVRILPDRFGGFDSTSFGYRLATPITYWNGLGIFAVMAILLALGFATRSRTLLSRALAAAAIPLLTATMYFTFSRGAWAALVVGLVAAVALDPQRLQLVACGLLLAPFAVAAVWAAEQREGLTTVGATFAQATDDGHSLVPILAVLAAVAAMVAVAFGVAERRLRVPRPVRTVFATALVALLAAGVGVVWAQHGSPWYLADRGWSSFQSPPKRSGADVSERLLQLSSNGRIDLWTTSWESFQHDPLLGNGAGTFWQLWAANGDRSFETLEGHSLYAETLGEMGIVGLTLLLVVLAAPLAAGVRARRSPLMPAALAAYAAWAAHAGIDWDWELVGVTSVALLVGAAMTRENPAPGRGISGWDRATLAVFLGVLAMASIPPLVADTAVSHGKNALPSGGREALKQAGTASRWVPWSSDPSELEGDAWRSLSQLGLSRRAYREALAVNPTNWNLWAKLSDVSEGADRRNALAEAHALNPRVVVEP